MAWPLTSRITWLEPGPARLDGARRGGVGTGEAVGDQERMPPRTSTVRPYRAGRQDYFLSAGSGVSFGRRPLGQVILPRRICAPSSPPAGGGGEG